MNNNNATETATFKCLCSIEVQAKDGGATLKNAQVQLTLSENLDYSRYANKKGALTLEGTKAQILCLANGIAATIKKAHANKVMSEDDSLEYATTQIIKSLSAKTTFV